MMSYVNGCRPEGRSIEGRRGTRAVMDVQYLYTIRQDQIQNAVAPVHQAPHRSMARGVCNRKAIGPMLETCDTLIHLVQESIGALGLSSEIQ
jgi:hypothetical protein